MRRNAMPPARAAPKLKSLPINAGGSVGIQPSAVHAPLLLKHAMQAALFPALRQMLPSPPDVSPKPASDPAPSSGRVPQLVGIVETVCLGQISVPAVSLNVISIFPMGRASPSTPVHAQYPDAFEWMSEFLKSKLNVTGITPLLLQRDPSGAFEFPVQVKVAIVF